MGVPGYALRDLLLQAQRIYPVTNVDFTIKAASVILTAPAGSNTRTPLSAGGSVTVQANTIAQNGNLFAPLGAITLGDATTQSVTLVAVLASTEHEVNVRADAQLRYGSQVVQHEMRCWRRCGTHACEPIFL